MNCILFAACLVVQVGADPAAGKPEADLQGTWIAHDRNPWRDGRPDPAVVGRRLTFDQGRFAVADPQGRPLHAGTYQIDGPVTTRRGQSAVAIRFVHDSGAAKGQTWLGLCATCGSLRITDNSSDPTRPRPSDYHPQDRQGYASIGYSRNGQP